MMDFETYCTNLLKDNKLAPEVYGYLVSLSHRKWTFSDILSINDDISAEIILIFNEYLLSLPKSPKI